MSFRGSWALKYVFWILLAITVLFLFVLPVVTSIMMRQSPQLPADFTRYLKFIEFVQSYLLKGLTATWVFFLGACFASFLNVVAWRIPRGRSILGSSACPNCETKLTFRDNVPVVGWIRNGGKCRTCENPIAIRYLYVELILGGLFLFLVLLQLVSGGINLPFYTPTEGGGFENVLFAPNWPLIQITGFHLTLVSMLFTFALIRTEGRNVPASIYVVFALMGTAMSFIWPTVHPVSWLMPDPASTFSWTYNSVAATVVTGLVVGVIVGVVVWWFRRDRIKSWSETEVDGTDAAIRMNYLFSFALCGLFLGWQAVLSCGLIFALLALLIETTRAGKTRPLLRNDLACFCLANVIHISLWRLSSSTALWPGYRSGPIEILISAFVLVLTLICLKKACTIPQVTDEAESPIPPIENG